MPRRPENPRASASTKRSPRAPGGARRGAAAESAAQSAQSAEPGESVEATGDRRPPKRRRLKPEARRAQLMACAMTVFARRGLGEARHAEIAAEAECSVATVFFYFPTRESLVDAVLDEVAAFLLSLATDLHSRDVPAEESLLAHLRAFAGLLEVSPGHVRVWLDWSTAVREHFWQRYLVFLEKLLAIIRRTLERGQRDGSISRRSSVDDQARLLVGSGHMLVLMKMAGASDERLEQFHATLMEAVTGKTRVAPGGTVAS